MRSGFCSRCVCLVAGCLRTRVCCHATLWSRRNGEYAATAASLAARARPGAPQAREGDVPTNAEPVEELWERVGAAGFDEVMERANRTEQGGAVVLVADDTVLSAFLGKVCDCGSAAARARARVGA